jgi:RHS repeat-associated protein
LLVRQTWLTHDTYNYIDFLYDESSLPYSFIYNGTQYFYIKNLQGDVVSIANASGTIVVNYEYDAWGNCISVIDNSGIGIAELNPIRYRSYYYDTETGFYYLQSRYYDPAIRRFINADGYVNANGDILGFNMYAYCGNNPVMYVDYTGEFVITILGVTLGTKAIVSIAVAAIASVAILSVAVPHPDTDTGVGNKPFDNFNNPLDNLKQNDIMFKVVIGSLGASLISSMHKAENKNVNGTAEHHIVPKQALLCRGAISKMESLGIDRNDPINIMTVSTRLHYYLHTQTYYFNVAPRHSSACLGTI